MSEKNMEALLGKNVLGAIKKRMEAAATKIGVGIVRKNSVSFDSMGMDTNSKMFYLHGRVRLKEGNASVLVRAVVPFILKKPSIPDKDIEVEGRV